MTKWKWGILAAVVALIAAAGVFYSSYHDRAAVESFSDCVGAGYPVSQTYPLQCEAGGKVFVKDGSDPTEIAIENVVTNFGGTMQLVSTDAPTSTAARAIWDNYRGLVSPSLLSTWMGDPSLAPGRPVSSPWPDHIDITSVERVGTTTYAVAGNVILLASDNVAHGGIAGKNAVTAMVGIEGGNWVIMSWREL